MQRQPYDVSIDGHPDIQAMDCLVRCFEKAMAKKSERLVYRVPGDECPYEDALSDLKIELKETFALIARG